MPEEAARSLEPTAELSPGQLREALDRVFLAALRPTVWVVGLLYVFFAVVDWATLPGDARAAVVAADLGAALLLGALALAVRRDVAPRVAHPAGAFVALVAVANAYVALVAHAIPEETATNLVIALAVSVFFLSWPWLAVVLVAKAASWAFAAWWSADAATASGWQQHGWALLATTVLAVLAHGVRLGLQARVENLREASQREAEARQRELDRLREMGRFKTQFMSTVSHELNTPLTPLKLQLHLLRSEGFGPLNGEQRRALGMLDRNVERLALLVQDMLDVARLQNGRLRLERQRLDLAAVVGDAALTFAESAKQAGLALDQRLAPGLAVEADPQRMAQVLHNLLSNAVKYTPRGGSIHVDMGRDGDMAVVRVRDTGLGLSGEQMARLFQPFTQVHDTRAQSRPGTGLGLYISKGIVEEHGGRIWVESPGPGKGSTFGFGVPLAGDEAAAAAQPSREPVSAGA